MYLFPLLNHVRNMLKKRNLMLLDYSFVFFYIPLFTLLLDLEHFLKEKNYLKFTCH